MEAFLAGGARTPLGRYGGALSGLRPDDLAALVIAETVRRAGVAAAAVDEVILGAAIQAGEDGRNVARLAALLAGLPEHVPGYTVNRLCAGGLTSVISAAQAVLSGNAEMIVAGGVESMSRAPWVMAKPDRAWSAPVEIADATAGWRFANPRLDLAPLGETAERVARTDGITRHESDEYALRSHERALTARDKGWFDDDILPVRTPTGIVTGDEGPHPDVRTLARLQPIFATDGIITSGSSAPDADGAAALLVAGRAALAEYDVRPRARVVAMAGVGVPPDEMGLGPVLATQRVLARAGWRVADLDAVELHEAYAPQVLGCVRRLGLDPDIVNSDGGAIALGHPPGCSGTRLVLTLLGRLEREDAVRGLATICAGGGLGLALLVERC